MVAVGVIPARGGSVGIPRKNLALLAGRPLLAYTCEAARGSGRLERSILSTDDPEIANVARAYGVEAPFLRATELAGDNTPMLPVLLDALDRAAPDAEVVVLLQPTSPLRRAAHIDDAVALLESSGADAVVSVVAVPHRFLPGSLLTLGRDGIVTPLAADAPLRRQDKPLLWARNGPAVYVARVAHLRDRGDLYGGVTAGYEMSPADSIDVDGAVDLALCETILRLQAR